MPEVSAGADERRLCRSGFVVRQTTPGAPSPAAQRPGARVQPASTSYQASLVAVSPS